jgi:hypothetical protein
MVPLRPHPALIGCLSGFQRNVLQPTLKCWRIFGSLAVNDGRYGTQLFYRKALKVGGLNSFEPRLHTFTGRAAGTARCYPVRLNYFPVLASKFPARMRREFRRKVLISADERVGIREVARNRRNSLYFSLLPGKFDAETGSISTASAAKPIHVLTRKRPFGLLPIGTRFARVAALIHRVTCRRMAIFECEVPPLNTGKDN